MGWGISVNHSHVAACGRYLLAWVAFVAFGVVLGWGLNPRLDEVAFMLALPLVVLLPYAAFCLLLPWLRLLAVGLQRATRFVGRVRLAPEGVQGAGGGAHGAEERNPDQLPGVTARPMHILRPPKEAKLP